jgi:hypothetical protein
LDISYAFDHIVLAKLSAHGVVVEFNHNEPPKVIFTLIQIDMGGSAGGVNGI